MIGTELLEDFVKTCAISYLVEGELDKPVSCLLIADRESGKTTVAGASDSTGTVVCTLVTGIGLLDELRRSPNAKVLVINDLTSIKGFRSNVTHLLVSVLNGFTEEGLYKIDLPGRKSAVCDFHGRRGTLIAAITTDMYMDERAGWKKMGFTSRCINFAYNLDKDLEVKIKDAQQYEDFVKLMPPEKVDSKFFAKKRQTKRQPKKIAVRVRSEHMAFVRLIVDSKAVQLEEKGIRLQKLYGTLIKAHALLHGRVVVNDEDILFLLRVNHFNQYPKKHWKRGPTGQLYLSHTDVLPDLNSDSFTDMLAEFAQSKEEADKRLHAKLKENEKRFMDKQQRSLPRADAVTEKGKGHDRSR